MVNRQSGKRWTYIKCFLPVLFAVCLCFVPKIAAKATTDYSGSSQMRKGYYWAASLDSEGSPNFMRPAVVVQFSEWDTEIITSYYYHEEETMMLYTDSGVYELEYYSYGSLHNDDDEEVNFCGTWGLEDEFAPVEALPVADSIQQGETVTFYGRSKENDAYGSIYEKKVTLADYNELNDGYIDYYVLSIDNYPQEELTYPAILLNEEEELVGIAFAKGAIFSMVEEDPSEFYVGTEEELSALFTDALEMHKGFYLTAFRNSNGEVAHVSPAIVEYDDQFDQTSVITDQYGYSETYEQDQGATAELLVDIDNVYDIQWQSAAADSDYIQDWYQADQWYITEGLEENQALRAAESMRQGEKATLYARMKEESVEVIYKEEVTLTEINEWQDEHGFDIEIDHYPETNLLYPAILVNEDDELLGIMIDSSTIRMPYSMRYHTETIDTIMETFYEENAKTDNGTDTDDPEKEDIDSEEELQDEESSGSAGWVVVMICIVAACIVVVLVVIVVILVSMKKKNVQQAPGIGTVPDESMNYFSTNTPPMNNSYGNTSSVEDIGATTPLYAETVPIEDIGATTPLYTETAPIEDIGPTAPIEPITQQEQPRFWIVAKDGYMEGRVYPVREEEITIGSNPDSVICYPNENADVSPVHAKLYWQDGQLMLMDCNSTSGTFLQRIGKMAPMEPVEVQNGDIFYIGEKKNGFEIRNGGN